MGLLNKMMGKTRFVVCRIFIHLSGSDISPILGVLNNVAMDAMDADGDVEVMGEGLVEICETLIRYDESWSSASNEGDVFFKEGDAGDYFDELFTDSAERYGAELNFDDDEPLSLPATRNVVVMLTVAFEGEVPELETDLTNMAALKQGLKAIINLQNNGKIRAIQEHYSPAQYGDELTNDQLLQHFPELIPL